MKRLTLVFCCAAALVVLGCGDKKDKGGKDKPAPAAKMGGAAKGAPADDGPKIDCPAFEKKMTECLDPFAAAYAKTEFGGKSGKKEIGGPVDEALAAKNYKMLWDLAGVQICSGGDAIVDTPFVKKDPRWKKRFAACDATAACDVWVPCMATAMGELLPAN